MTLNPQSRCTPPTCALVALCWTGLESSLQPGLPASCLGRPAELFTWHGAGPGRPGRVSVLLDCVHPSVRLAISGSSSEPPSVLLMEPQHRTLPPRPQPDQRLPFLQPKLARVLPSACWLWEKRLHSLHPAQRYTRPPASHPTDPTLHCQPGQDSGRNGLRVSQGWNC